MGIIKRLLFKRDRFTDDSFHPALIFSRESDEEDEGYFIFL